MFSSTSPTKVPLSSFIAVLALACLSTVWMPALSDLFLKTLSMASLEKKSERAEWKKGEELFCVKASETDLARLRWENERLSRENEILRREIADLGAFRKSMGGDLRFVSVGLVSLVSRIDRHLLVINAGRDAGVREGDWLVQGFRLAGTVSSVAESCSLVEGLAVKGARLIARIEDLEGEFLWTGDGGGRARIQAPEGCSAVTEGRKVYLSSPASLGGGLLLGKIVGLEDDMGGMVQLVAKAVPLDPAGRFHVIQTGTYMSPELFMQRDRLSTLKGEVKKLELQRLRAEMLRK